MGFLDDAASVITGTPSTYYSKSHRSKSHRSSRHKDHSRSKSRSRSHSRHRSAAGGGLGGIAASVFGYGGEDDKHSSSKKHRDHKSSSHKRDHSPTRSFFGGLGGGDYNKHNASRSSFFSGFGGGSRSPSYYKRSPRPNFVSRVLKRLKRLLRDLIYYAKKHPIKVFMLVIMPLVTGGALTALLAKFGLRLPAALTSMLGLAAKASTGDGIGLVGEAVKMASGGFGGGGGHSHASIERGKNGGMQWERRSVEKDGGFGLGDIGKMAGMMGGGGLDGLKGVAKMFS